MDVVQNEELTWFRTKVVVAGFSIGILGRVNGPDKYGYDYDATLFIKDEGSPYIIETFGIQKDEIEFIELTTEELQEWMLAIMKS